MGYTDPAIPSYTKPPSRVGRYVLIGCLVVLLLIVASCVVVGVLAARWGAEYERVVGGSDVNLAITKLLTTYASEVGEGDIADQYEDVYLSQRYKSTHTVAEFETAEANVRLVDYLGVTVRDITPNGSSATASMDVEGAAGDRFTIDFTLVREEGLWRVDDFQLSPG